MKELELTNKAYNQDSGPRF